MSEKYPVNHERSGELASEHEAQHEVARHAAETAKETRHEQAEQIEQIRHEAQEKARPRSETPIEKQEKTAEVNTIQINRSVKEAARRRIMKRVRKNLRADERIFSKFTHSPTVDAVSRAAEKTVARPSGLLGGSLCAFLGSTAYLWIARHYGYDYNYLLFVLLFIGGFVFGTILELVVRAVRGKRRTL